MSLSYRKVLKNVFTFILVLYIVANISGMAVDIGEFWYGRHLVQMLTTIVHTMISHIMNEKIKI